MKTIPPYPKVLKDSFYELCSALRLPGEIPFDEWAQACTQIGLLPNGSAHVIEAFIKRFRAINPKAQLWVIGDEAILKDYDFFRDESHCSFIPPPKGTELQEFLIFHKSVQLKNIDPWVFFLASEMGIGENLQITDRISAGINYFFTPKQRLIPITQEERQKHALSNKQAAQMAIQHWQQLPAWITGTP